MTSKLQHPSASASFRQSTTLNSFLALSFTCKLPLSYSEDDHVTVTLTECRQYLFSLWVICVGKFYTLQRYREKRKVGYLPT